MAYKLKSHVIRDGNQTPLQGLVNKPTDQWEFNQLRKDFIVQVTDGNIAVYKSDSGRKGALVIELNDQRIKNQYPRRIKTLDSRGSSDWYKNGRSAGNIQLELDVCKCLYSNLLIYIL